MPLIQINMAKGRTAAEKKAMMEAITEAVVASVGAPRPSVRIWINEFETNEFMAGGELLSDRGKPAAVASADS